jgi:hypothetical protein
VTYNPNKKYLWVRSGTNESLVIVTDPFALFRGNQFDEVNDKLYIIGDEVKMQVTFVPIRKETPHVTREMYGDQTRLQIRFNAEDSRWDATKPPDRNEWDAQDQRDD